MYKKYFAWSLDDGLEQDKKIIEILKEFEMGATFHLNSGLFGDQTYEGRIGNLGMIEKPALGKWHLLSYVPHFRIPKDEVCQVYQGFEIAAHGKTHKLLTKCGPEELKSEITDDVEALSALFNREITGFAYPYGKGAKQCRQTLQAAGIRYARTVSSSMQPDFRFPEDPLNMPLTCWHVSKKTFTLLDNFFQASAQEEDLFFLMLAHGYEFDFETKESSWSKFRRICETVKSHDDIVCCSIADAFKLSGRWGK